LGETKTWRGKKGALSGKDVNVQEMGGWKVSRIVIEHYESVADVWEKSLRFEGQDL